MIITKEQAYDLTEMEIVNLIVMLSSELQERALLSYKRDKRGDEYV